MGIAHGTARLQEIEDSLGPKVVEKFNKVLEEKGTAEQFRPSKAKLTCTCISSQTLPFKWAYG